MSEEDYQVKKNKFDVCSSVIKYHPHCEGLGWERTELDVIRHLKFLDRLSRREIIITSLNSGLLQ